MTGISEALHLAQLLCARLCHDLSGPLGALIGVVEVAREEQPDSETLALAEETAAELAQRLRLLRAAWGQDGDDLDVARLRDPNALFSPQAARVVLNLLLLAAESLPGGGIVAVAGSPSNSVLVTISGPRAGWPTGLGVWLTDEEAALQAMTANARGLQAPLTTLLARSHGFRLSMPMPSGPVSEAEFVPPLLLSLRQP